MKNLPLIVIVGPTASGKTALAIELAQKYGGEVVCADSRTVYTGMNIGTAKPTKEERALVPHWGLDLIAPNERFTAADFKKYTLEKIANIRARGKVPFLVGGTGLYIDAVLFDYQFGKDGDSEQRRDLAKMSVEELQEYCRINNIELPKNQSNPRHLVRAIEQKGINQQRRDVPISTSVIVGIATNNATLRANIVKRSEQLLTKGVVDEASLLGKKYGWESEAMTGNIYPLIRRHLQGELSVEELSDKFTTLDWKLAKRQLTWFRRNPYILWATKAEASDCIQQALAVR